MLTFILFIVNLIVICAGSNSNEAGIQIFEYDRHIDNDSSSQHVIIFLMPGTKNQNARRIDKNLYRYYYFTKEERKRSYSANDVSFLFREFKSTHNKTYENDVVERQRLEIFTANLDLIQHLKENEQGTAIYGVTKFADMTVEEFLHSRTGYVRNNKVRNRTKAVNVDNLPDSRDWRKSGAVTEVKNQGNCGSCWAFSVTGNIEGVWKIRKGALVSLSEQQLVDCDKVDAGCSGGDMLDAYKEIERMGGMETETEYPYKASRARSCRFNSSEVRVYINDSVSLPKDEQQMAKYVDDNGPISIGLNASPLMFYMGGIVHPWRLFCNPHHLNHGVLIVGFGVEKNKPFWIIKNSWGARWGEAGYFRLFRGQGVCGVDQDASSVAIN